MKKNQKKLSINVSARFRSKFSLVVQEKANWLMISFNTTVKGIVHPKMKILSLITHPHVVPNP